MARRDHFRLDIVVRQAAKLQEVDAELGEVERLLRLDQAGAGGTCPSCGALHARGAVYCWQCGADLMSRQPAGGEAPPPTGVSPPTPAVDGVAPPTPPVEASLTGVCAAARRRRSAGDPGAAVHATVGSEMGATAEPQSAGLSGGARAPAPARTVDPSA